MFVMFLQRLGGNYPRAGGGQPGHRIGDKRDHYRPDSKNVFRHRPGQQAEVQTLADGGLTLPSTHLTDFHHNSPGTLLFPHLDFILIR